MSDSSRPDRQATVLRAVALQAQAHVLRRPPAPAPAATASARQQVSAEAAQQDRYHQGYAQGMIDGQLAERKVAAAAAQGAGYQQGLLQGQSEARKAAYAEVAQRVAALDTLLRQLPVQLDARLDDAEDDLIALCFEVVCEIAGAGAVTADGVGRLVRQAAARLRPQRALTLHLHPQDVAMLKADPAGADWLRDDAWPDGIALLADREVALGGAIVRTAHGSLDARLETQLGLLKSMLLRERAKLLGAGGGA